jgi:hypothetical protein
VEGQTEGAAGWSLNAEVPEAGDKARACRWRVGPLAATSTAIPAPAGPSRGGSCYRLSGLWSRPSIKWKGKLKNSLALPLL